MRWPRRGLNLGTRKVSVTVESSIMRRILMIALVLAASTARAQNPPQPGFFVDAQLLKFNSDIRESYELSPRYVFGYDDVLGARVRYWGYDHNTQWQEGIATNTNRLDFDVIDLEATTHVRYEGSDFLFAG